MFVPIEVNTEDIFSQFDVSEQEVDGVLDFIAKEITGKIATLWELEAEQTLKQTRDRYINSINVIDSGRMSGAIILSYKDPLVKMLEEGASPYDMKTFFEKSSKVKYNSKGGWYLTIPFKLGAPETQGDTLGISQNLPPEVHAVLKDKSVDVITGRSQGLTSEEIPSQYQAPKTRAAIQIPQSKTFEAYTHKSSTFQGAFKQTDPVTGQNSYGSFRRVGENSDGNSWIHPGLPELNLAQKALDRFQQTEEVTITEAINEALASIGL